MSFGKSKCENKASSFVSPSLPVCLGCAGRGAVLNHISPAQLDTTHKCSGFSSTGSLIAGNYQSLPSENLPLFWVAYLGDPSDSGKIHSDVSVRWHKGDADVINGMRTFAEITDQAKCVTFLPHSHPPVTTWVSPTRLECWFASDPRLFRS